MKLTTFDEIVRRLNEAGVKYLIVGGFAVNAHGFLRFTQDLDLVIHLTDEDITKAFAALDLLGYRPSLPITLEQFKDPATRECWRKEKQMRVLKMWSQQHPETNVDIFIYEPFDFDQEYAKAYWGKDAMDPEVRFASIPTLIAMKKIAGRPQDLLDIEKLEKILKLSPSDG